MNWKCLFGHDWRYSKQNFDLKEIFGSGQVIHVDMRVRTCKRCYKKQRKTETINPVWKDISLTKSEERDKKLKELGL